MEQITDKLRNWASILEPEARAQACRTASLDVVEGVALMPDAHWGMGATVGSVIATKDTVIPAAVGVDIGCGMIAAKLVTRADQLPESMDGLLPLIAKAIPAGVGQGHDASRTGDVNRRWEDLLAGAHFEDAKLLKTAWTQLGSLGSGNHFFEVCLDRNDQVWVVLHSGSRGIGNKLALGHIREAKRLARELHLRLEDQDLAYLREGQPEFDAYVYDMLWAQRYARDNREVMMDAALKAIRAFLGWSGALELTRINCHHNFTQREVVDGETLWVTRKGAIKADVGDYGVIPGSMGARSYVVKGLGNANSYYSCSHGAGRAMSRKAAKRQFTPEDLAAQMEGVGSWQAGLADQLVDEIPAAYKSIDVVMEDQKDLVSIEAELRQIVNYKGT